MERQHQQAHLIQLCEDLHNRMDSVEDAITQGHAPFIEAVDIRVEDIDPVNQKNLTAILDRMQN